ncbi:hypothetical protein [Qipengyuania sp. RANM35]|uniref:hypothetical protein n=1 Tax=Qipengyuania sp. RANM35 TaxID=3068635 RepID=UPI0034DB4AB4
MTKPDRPDGSVIDPLILLVTASAFFTVLNGCVERSNLEGQRWECRYVPSDTILSNIREYTYDRSLVYMLGSDENNSHADAITIYDGNIEYRIVSDKRAKGLAIYLHSDDGSAIPRLDKSNTIIENIIKSPCRKSTEN